MIRHAAAFAVALCLSPSGAFAQGVTFTVSASSANVYNGPSTGSVVIGQAQRGAVLEITRELGSWVKVVWPRATDGVGYVHVSNGSIARGAPGPGSRPAAATVAAVNGASDRADGGVQTNAGTPAPQGNAYTYIAPPTHHVGLGGGIGGTTFGVGASARTWTRKRLGVQFAVTRDALTSVASSERVSTLRFAPSVLWLVRDRVSDYVWVRPYVGGGAIFYRSTLTGGALGTGASVSARGLGFQTFGGGEVTFASVPQVAISAELAYRRAGTPFPGFDLSGLGFSVSAHWYVK